MLFVVVFQFRLLAVVLQSAFPRFPSVVDPSLPACLPSLQLPIGWAREKLAVSRRTLKSSLFFADADACSPCPAFLSLLDPARSLAGAALRCAFSAEYEYEIVKQPSFSE